MGFLMTRWRWGLLVFELFLFALILVLPQVELPETAFPAGTTPIVAKHRLADPPTFVVARPILAAVSTAADAFLVSSIEPPVRLGTMHRQEVLCVFLC